LELLTTRLTREENEAITAEPTDREITQIVQELKKEKAPGIDGITAEMLVACWAFMGKDCCALVHTFWKDKKLTRQMIAAVIKLIPKGGARQLIRNWRPISLLNVTYKIIAKLLSNRIKKVLPRLVGVQQTGFIEGRSIQDNILTLKLVQEKVIREKTPVAMLQIDFQKAYDRVDHQFVWSVMRKMGFDEMYIELVQALVVEGTVKVHFNGSFTERVQLQRGVCQGCPLAPLLYALIKQPLMDLLQEQNRTGKIQGVDVGEGHQLVYQLFADDTGIFSQATEDNFKAVMATIQKFEQISEAKVNLEKSRLL
jgi:hypothetical protein